MPYLGRVRRNIRWVAIRPAAAVGVIGHVSPRQASWDRVRHVSGPIPKYAQKNMINYSAATPGDQPSKQAAPKRPHAKLHVSRPTRRLCNQNECRPSGWVGLPLAHVDVS